MAARQQLEGLLLDLFDEGELRAWVRRVPGGDRLHAELPSPPASPALLAGELVGVFNRRGLIDGRFWDRLVQDRPCRAGDIDAVRRLWSAAPEELQVGHDDRPRILLLAEAGTTPTRLATLVAAVRAAVEGHALRPHVLEGAATTPRGLQEQLARHQPHLLVVVGDGAPPPGWRLSGPRGGDVPAPRAALAPAFRHVGHSLHLLVLDGCFAGDQARLLGGLVPGLVGLPDALPAEASDEFRRSLVAGLADDQPVAAAFELGNAALALYGLGADALPLLLAAPGVDLGTLGLVRGSPQLVRPPGPERVRVLVVLDGDIAELADPEGFLRTTARALGAAVGDPRPEGIALLTGSIVLVADLSLAGARALGRQALAGTLSTLGGHVVRRVQLPGQAPIEVGLPQGSPPSEPEPEPDPEPEPPPAPGRGLVVLAVAVVLVAGLGALGWRLLVGGEHEPDTAATVAATEPEPVPETPGPEPETPEPEPGPEPAPEPPPEPGEPVPTCLAISAPSALVTLSSAGGRPLDGAAVTWARGPGRRASPCERDGELWVCGQDYAGPMLVRATAECHGEALAEIAVEQGPCHVETRELALRLEPAGCDEPVDTCTVHGVDSPDARYDQRLWDMVGARLDEGFAWTEADGADVTLSLVEDYADTRTCFTVTVSRAGVVERCWEARTATTHATTPTDEAAAFAEDIAALVRRACATR